MATTNKTFCLLSFLFGSGCLVSILVSFASDRWVVSTETEVAGFKNLGLWSACFAKFHPPAWVLNKIYDGCWWVFDREMDDLRVYLIPSWFVATQVLVTLSLVFQLLAILIMIVNSVNCFPHSRFKDGIALGLSSTAAVLHGLTAIFLSVAVIMFGVRADNERTWLERPDQNYLSWSFGICVLAAFLAILAFVTVSLESYRLWLKRKNNEEPEELFTVPTPATNYVSVKTFPSADSQYPNPRVQPAYSSRYSNQESQSFLNTNPNEAGDFYTNQMSTENRQKGRTNGYVPQHDRRQIFPASFQEKSPIDRRSGDSVGSDSARTTNTAPSSQSYSASSKTAETSTDYEESKKIKQPVLPEYIPKTKLDAPKKKDIDSTFDESFDSDDKLNDDVDQHQSRKTKSKSDGKKTASTLSKKHKNKKNSGSDHNKDSETGRSSRRSTSKDKRGDNSDDEHSRGRQRTKKSTSPSTKRRNSRSRERSSSRHQSRSRDRNSSYSESCSDSDAVSVSSRSRRRQKDSSRKNSSRHPSSEECVKKDKKHRQSTSSAVSSKKKRAGSFTDISTYENGSKQKSKRKGDGARLQDVKRAKSQEILDTESLSSKQSKRGGSRPKSSYSSYYEY